MNSLIWKGVSSTTIKGLLICELPPITSPQMRVSETVIDGRDGSSFEELGYSSYDKAVQIGLYGEYDIDKVIKYFTGEGDIIFSNEPTKVYSAKICSQIDYNRLLRYRQATVVFRVQPFKHKYNEAFKETQSATASGTSIVVSDSEEAHLKAFKIYGKSTQDGTPSPDAPIDIVSVGDDGNIAANICGKNLLNIIGSSNNGITVINDGNKIILNGTNSNNYATRVKLCDVALRKNITYCLSGGKTEDNMIVVSKTISSFEIQSGNTFGVYTSTEDVTMGVYIRVASGQTLNNYTLYPQLEIGNAATKYEPYKNQSITLSNTLRAIPVTDKSLVTYTDASGKMWCADEIDLNRGVYIQRVKMFELAVADMDNIENFAGWKGLTDLFECFPTGINTNFPYPSNVGTITSINTSNSNSVLYLSGELYGMTQTQWKAKYPDLVCVFLLPLITPIETPLTDEQIAICKSLKANNPTTTILNDENAYMLVEYIKPFEVMNEGLEPSKPIMTLNGSGTVEISVNGVGVFTYTFPEGENEVVIDSEKQDAYLGDVLKNRNMNGEFPILQPKTNRIGWSGDIKNIKVVPRSRWL